MSLLNRCRVVFNRRKKIPIWVGLSLSANVVLALLLIQGQREMESVEGRSLRPITDTPSGIPAQAKIVSVKTGVQQSSTPAPTPSSSPSPAPAPDKPQSHHLTYQEWVELLAREAQVAATQQPENLSILAGDSISLWFPPTLLPPGRTWLNQGISGETSGGLYRRLPLLDGTNPKTIFILIGINDLLKGVSDREILDNHKQIIQDLKWNHPQTKLVIQSILPHQGPQATWEQKERLLSVSNERIRQLNQHLWALAQSHGVYYLDLYPLFATAQGSLRAELTTDGLHLNHQGYLIWSTAMQMFSQHYLDSRQGYP